MRVYVCVMCVCEREFVSVRVFKCVCMCVLCERERVCECQSV